MSRVGRGGKTAHETPYHHPLRVGLSPPPPFDVVVWVLGLLLLVVSHLRLGRVSFLFSEVVCKSARIVGEFVPLLVAPLPRLIPLFCTLLCFQRMMHPGLSEVLK